MYGYLCFRCVLLHCFIQCFSSAIPSARDSGDANADIKLTEVTNEEEVLDFNEKRTTLLSNELSLSSSFSPSTDSSELSDSMTTEDNLHQENNESKNQQEIPTSSVLLNEEEREDRSLFEVDSDFDFFRVKTNGGYYVIYEGSGWFFETAFGEDW